MKINEIISRKDAEQRFAQMVKPREVKPAPAPEPTTKTHTIKKLPKHVEPVRTFKQLDSDIVKKIEHRKNLSKKFEMIAPRAIKIAKENYQTLPVNVANFDYKPWIEDIRYNIEGRLDTTIDILEKVIAALVNYAKRPAIGTVTINALSDFIQLANKDRAEAIKAIREKQAAEKK